MVTNDQKYKRMPGFYQIRPHRLVAFTVCGLFTITRNQKPQSIQSSGKSLLM